MSDDECPGEGKCHGCLKWCDHCGDVKHVCDVRLRGDRCDEHPEPHEFHVLRIARRAAESKIAHGEQLARAALKDLGEVIEMENARREYDRQIAAAERKAMR